MTLRISFLNYLLEYNPVAVSYTIPGTGAPCTSSARKGRWRSFPYLKEPNSEQEKHALWQYLCQEWNAKSNDELLKYNFFMLQADVLPEMEFGPTIKRKIVEWDCRKAIEIQESVDRKILKNEAWRDEERKFVKKKKTLGGYKYEESDEL